MKIFSFVIVCLTTINFYSQTLYKSGYFTDNLNRKTECLIKSEDWKNNPSNFKYKISESSQVQTASIEDVKTFGIYDVTKYIKSQVKIDVSRSNISFLSDDRNPDFKEKELFLKVLVEGKANLYVYEDAELVRYFYSLDNHSVIEQLIFKSYRYQDTKIKQNNRYKQQIWSDLKCDNITEKAIESLDYNKTDLINVFVKYNQCTGSDYVSIEKKPKRNLFHLSIRPGIRFASLDIENTRTHTSKDFDSEIGFSLGVELEVVFPFNNNKWALIVEPTYQYYKTSSTLTHSTSALEEHVNVDYSSIEVPIGLRYCFFVNPDSKIFVDTQFVVDFEGDSAIESDKITNLKLNSHYNLVFGLGYKFKEKYSVQARYMTPKNLLGDYNYWTSDYKAFSIVFGYTLF
ncbi:outer membrane beta-barrel protein [Formosa sp. A9]|uniref:outer membrane beta-barrel protein n=1 Tax=Formosa sp. A9 TaxID=3442641 RepID=UPI003EBE134B